MMTKVFNFWSVIILLLAASISYGSSMTEKLTGKWKCIRERDRAKIVSGYMESIEFTPDELLLFYKPGPPIRCSYSVAKNIIRATNLETKEKMKFDFKFLKNGDLYLHKEPWNWEGWFSRDFEKPRKVFRGKTKETRSIEITMPANTEKTSIGSATMEQNGTIVLQLRAEGPNGVIGDSLIRYSPNHPEYKNILKHLGGLKKGEVKPVPPWPEK